MKKMAKYEFLFALAYALSQARLNRGGLFCKGYQVREAIDRSHLPLPTWNNLDKADEELRKCGDPIFRAVDELSEPGAGKERCNIYQTALVEAAWKHYESLFPLVRGGARYGIDPRVET